MGHREIHPFLCDENYLLLSWTVSLFSILASTQLLHCLGSFINFYAQAIAYAWKVCQMLGT